MLYHHHVIICCTSTTLPRREGQLVKEPSLWLTIIYGVKDYSNEHPPVCSVYLWLVYPHSIISSLPFCPTWCH